MPICDEYDRLTIYYDCNIKRSERIFFAVLRLSLEVNSELIQSEHIGNDLLSIKRVLTLLQK